VKALMEYIGGDKKKTLKFLVFLIEICWVLGIQGV
jgi:hypothetical protein